VPANEDANRFICSTNSFTSANPCNVPVIDDDDKGPMRFLLLNAASLSGKRDLLSLMVDNDVCVDVILVCETWGNSNVSDAEFALQGFKMYRSDRTQRQHGGVVIYVRESIASLSASPVAGGVETYDDIVACSICLRNNEKMLVMCAYRAESNSATENEALFDVISSLSDQAYSHIVLGGDFNYRDIDWLANDWSPRCNSFMEAILSAGLHQHVFRPTRRSSVLDLVFTNEEHMVEYLDIVPGISDHDAVSFGIVCSPRSIQAVSKPRYRNTNWALVNEELKRRLCDFPVLGDPNRQWAFLHGVILSMYAKYSKKVSLRELKRRPVWADAACWRSLKYEKNAYRAYQRSRSDASWNKYQAAIAIANSYSKTAVWKYEKGIAKVVNINPKKFWGYSNSRMKSPPVIGAIKTPNGDRVVDPYDCANVFNDFFATVFTNESTGPLPDCPLKTGAEINDALFTVDDIVSAVKGCRSNAAPGQDCISNVILKSCISSLALYLAILFRNIMDTGIYPYEWKNALVCPVHKKGPMDEASNFRPISLTSAVSKIFETILRSSLMDHVVANRLFNDSQFGFLRGKSCVLQLLDCLDYITRAIDEGDCADMIYMDFAKAFDKVPHRRLCKKLRSYGVSGKMLRVLESFLSDRTQQVVVHGTASAMIPVVSGVPQGSVLGPTLFLFYIDDIDQGITSIIRKFADDTKLIQRVDRHCPLPGISSLQYSLDTALEWVRLWESTLHADKFVCLHFGNGNPCHVYAIDGMPIPTADAHKDLGVWISCDLKASKHCKEVTVTATKIVHLIKRSLRYFDKGSYMLLYKALVRSRLEYASCAWNPHYDKDRRMIEGVQRLATRLIPGMRDFSYHDRLRRLGLQTLETRRMRADLILLYQLVHGLVDYDVNILFEFAPDIGTRGHGLKLRVRGVPSCDARKFFFVNRVIAAWNRLPSEIAEAPSLTVFKQKLHESGSVPEL
jgi:hypothetical protein